MANENLASAKNAKKDEFYTMYEDIQREVNAYLEYNPDTFRDKVVLCPCDDPEWSNFTRFFAQNFEMLGLKKLISTSYAADSKKRAYKLVGGYEQISLYDVTEFESNDPKYDANLTHVRGKIFTLTRDGDSTQHININNLQWTYLDGDGDFRSEEVTRLRDEADIIVTNPPFSLGRAFIAWLMDSGKQFLIISNQNAVTYKEVFPLIQNGKMWFGVSIHSGDREFRVPDDYPLNAAGCRVDDNGNKYIRVKGVRWFTNIDHGRRHEPLALMTMADNLRFSRHKIVCESGYPKYDDYDAIDVPYTDAIPSDYDGVMGVPITFMDKYCPEQFEIIGLDRYTVPKQFLVGGRVAINGKPCYARILIRHKRGANAQ